MEATETIDLKIPVDSQFSIRTLSDSFTASSPVFGPLFQKTNQQHLSQQEKYC
jgi:hypothetical protein